MSYCFKCNNTGWIACYCGGDLCVCGRGGEMDCPECDGMGGFDDDLYDYDPDESVPEPQKPTP